MGKTPCCEKIGLRRGKWTSEEDEVLIKYIQANGEGSWKSLAKNAGLLRCGKSCRLRWVNYLRKDLKRGNFTREEEELIFKLHSSLGNRWSAIARHLPGRTDNEIKNYWITHLSRKTYMFYRTKCDSSEFTIETHNMNNRIKKKPGRVSRRFAKKYKHHKEYMGKLNTQTIGNNSNYANESMKEIHICPNEMKMVEIEELESKNDEPMDMINFLLEGDTIDLDGILWDYNEDQIENSLTEVDFDHFKTNASHVYDQEDKNIRSNSSQLVGFCFDEDLVSDWEMGLGFEGINICDNVDDQDDMFLWEWD